MLGSTISDGSILVLNHDDRNRISEQVRKLRLSWNSYDWDEGDAPVFRDITHSVDDTVAFLNENENKNTINDMLVENFK